MAQRPIQPSSWDVRLCVCVCLFSHRTYLQKRRNKKKEQNDQALWRLQRKKLSSSVQIFGVSQLRDFQSIWVKMKILKSNFWLDKYVNMGPQHTKRCRIATFWGFQEKSWFFNIFMRKSWFMIFDITMELHCNLKNHKSCISNENIEKSTFI